MGRTANRERFAEAAREEQPDLALLCLLIGVEAASAPGLPYGGRTAAPEPDTPTGTAPDGTQDAVPEAAPETAAETAADQSVDQAQIELDRLAGLLPYERGRTPEQWAQALERLLGQDQGFQGTPADYRRLDSSLLQSVLRRRRGLPILLSVVWMEVARRAGAPVHGVALPGHFVVGFGDPHDGGVLADPFGGGRLLGESDAELLVASATGKRGHVPRALLEPAGPLEIVLRILNNIRAWAAARPEQSQVQLWALELSLLLPHHPARLRFEHAQLLVERGEFTAGADEMEAYADVVAAMEPSSADAVRRTARAARARLN